MATNTAATSSRYFHTQQTGYFRKRALGAAGNATYSLGFLPAGANILRITTLARTVFSGGTPVVSFGTAAAPTAFFAAAGAPLTTAGRNSVTLIAIGSLGVDVDTEIVAAVTGVPTAGIVDFEVEFTMPNDQ